MRLIVIILNLINIQLSLQWDWRLKFWLSPCEELEPDFAEMQNVFRRTVFGQPFIHNTILPLLQAHFNSNYSNKKPLVFSFHGIPGTGKNFVADIIAKTIFPSDYKFTKYRHYFTAAHFYTDYKDRNKLATTVYNAVAECERAIFIFDEIDKTPAGYFDVLKPFMDFLEIYQNVDFRHCIFIFLSNIGGSEIMEKSNELTKKNYDRSSWKLKEFEKLLKIISYNVDGGLHRANIIEHHLVDSFVPFLPLEAHHVKKCILSEMKRQKIHLTEIQINEILEELTFDDIYSVNGCKSISTSVKKLKYYNNLKLEL